MSKVQITHITLRLANDAEFAENVARFLVAFDGYDRPDRREHTKTRDGWKIVISKWEKVEGELMEVENVN